MCVRVFGGLGASNAITPQVTARCWRSCQSGRGTGETGDGELELVVLGGPRQLLERPWNLEAGCWEGRAGCTWVTTCGISELTQLALSLISQVATQGWTLHESVLNFQQAPSPSQGSFGHGKHPLVLKNQQCSPLPSQLGGSPTWQTLKSIFQHPQETAQSPK